jgi:hypothetical protein
MWSADWICMWRVPYLHRSSPNDLCGDLASAVSWACRHHHSKVLVSNVL